MLFCVDEQFHAIRHRTQSVLLLLQICMWNAQWIHYYVLLMIGVFIDLYNAIL